MGGGWGRSTNSVLLVKTERKTANGRPGLSYDNIKIDLKETRWDGVERINLLKPSVFFRYHQV